MRWGPGEKTQERAIQHWLPLTELLPKPLDVSPLAQSPPPHLFSRLFFLELPQYALPIHLQVKSVADLLLLEHRVDAGAPAGHTLGELSLDLGGR